MKDFERQGGESGNLNNVRKWWNNQRSYGLIHSEIFSQNNEKNNEKDIVRID